MPDKIRQCKEYIEERLKEKIPSSALEESCSDFKVLSFIDSKIYHKVAQTLNITEVIKNYNIYYTIEVPMNGTWAIILSHDLVRSFEDQYKDTYKIVKPKFEPTSIDTTF